VAPRDGIRRGVGGCSASGMNARLAHWEKTLRLGCRLPGLNLPNRRIRDPYVRWCGRGEAVRSLPIPIRPRFIGTLGAVGCSQEASNTLYEPI